ncbi:hypothetical protein [Lentilitoribacter sp. Alg239-R112]|uniref:hypothetical protein n=1 Tax=Lentilitoribacter sp. Alg239-R112 TaxID=2305987 RepID=UPI0013A6FD29|nr:hypothetical protein [Lentilitoribacter sp. Alg239-R112]
MNVQTPNQKILADLASDIIGMTDDIDQHSIEANLRALTRYMAQSFTDLIEQEAVEHDVIVDRKPSDFCEALAGEIIYQLEDLQSEIELKEQRELDAVGYVDQNNEHRHGHKEYGVLS